MPKQKLIHRILYLYSSLTQLISLITISNLFWIKVEKPFSQMVKFDNGEVLKYKGIVKLEFLVLPSRIANHLQETAKGIYNYMTKEWEICLEGIHSHYHVKIHRFKVPTPQLSSIPGVGQLFLDQPRVVLTEPQTGFFLTGAVDQGSCAP